MVITQATNNSVVPDGVEVAPVLLNSHVLDKGKTINVTMTNHTDRPISVQPSGLICELQWCTPEEGLDITNNDSETDTLNGQSFDLSNCTLNEEQRDKLVSLQSNWQSVFALGENIGYTGMVKHRIELESEKPFKDHPRHILPAMYDEVRLHLKQLLDTNIIRKSHSPWCSNVVLVQKKNGSLRMCVDYRKLNQLTIKDSFARPRIDETLDWLSGCKYFSVLDMKSGYHQVELVEKHKERTAFSVGSLGMYEFNRMPFGY